MAEVKIIDQGKFSLGSGISNIPRLDETLFSYLDVHGRALSPEIASRLNSLWQCWDSEPPEDRGFVPLDQRYVIRPQLFKDDAAATAYLDRIDAVQRTFIELKSRYDLEEYRHRASLPELAASLLVARNLDAHVESILFANMRDHFRPIREAIDGTKLISTLGRRLLDGSRVIIYGDMDCDGICGVAVQYHFLRWLGIEPLVLHSDRFRGGHGAKVSVLESVNIGPNDTVLFVDHGSHEQDAMNFVRARGAAALVIDHHDDPRVTVDAIVNPKQPGCTYSEELVASGLSQRVVMDLKAWLMKWGSPELKARATSFDPAWTAPIAMIGTIGDMANMLDPANRALVKFGLKQVERCPYPGVQALVASSRIKQISSTNVGMLMSARLNAPRRVNVPGGEFDRDGEVSSLLMRVDHRDLDPNGAQTAAELAKVVEKTSNARKATEHTQVRAAYKVAEKALLSNSRASSLTLEAPEFDEGHIGLVAARVKDRFNVTAFCAATGTDGTIKVSGRSTDQVPIGDMLTSLEARQFQKSGGGHPRAGGAVFTDRTNFERWKATISRMAGSYIASSPALAVTPDRAATMAELVTHAAAFHAADEFLQPYGNGFKLPTVYVKDVRTVLANRLGLSHFSLFLSDKPGKNLVWGNAFHTIEHSAIAHEDRATGKLIPTSTTSDLLVNLGMRHWQYRGSPRATPELLVERSWTSPNQPPEGDARDLTASTVPLNKKSRRNKNAPEANIEIIDGNWVFKPAEMYGQFHLGQNADPVLVSADAQTFDRRHAIYGIRRDLVEHTPGQALIVHDLLLNRENGAYEAGTGSGKTTVLAMLTAHGLSWGDRIMVIVNTRGLATQIYNELVKKIDLTLLSERMGRPVRIDLLCGGMTKEATAEVTGFGGPQCVIGTASKLKAAMFSSSHALDPKSIVTVLIDERQSLVKNSSGAQILSGMKAAGNESFRTVVQSAFHGRTHAERAAILKTVGASHIESYSTPLREIQQVQTKIPLPDEYLRWDLALSGLMAQTSEDLVEVVNELKLLMPNEAGEALNRWRTAAIKRDGTFHRPMQKDFADFHRWVGESLNRMDPRLRGTWIELLSKCAEFGLVLSFHNSLISYGPVPALHLATTRALEYFAGREEADDPEKHGRWKFDAKAMKNRVLRSVLREISAGTPYQELLDLHYEELFKPSVKTARAKLDQMFGEYAAARDQRTRIQGGKERLETTFKRESLHEMARIPALYHPREHALFRALESAQNMLPEKTLVLCDEASYCTYLLKRFQDSPSCDRRNPRIFLGKKHSASLRSTGMADMDAQLQDVRTGKSSLLVSDSAIHFGIDIPYLHSCAIMHAIASSEVFLQVIGRLGRTPSPSHQDETPLLLHSFVVGSRAWQTLPSNDEIRTRSSQSGYRSHRKLRTDSPYTIVRPFSPNQV